MIRIDMTKKHPNQDELQGRYQIKGFPTIIFINRDGVVETELRIESFVSPDVIIDRMKQLIEKS
jgi:thioredoxin:protein disulfide reductase